MKLLPIYHTDSNNSNEATSRASFTPSFPLNRALLNWVRWWPPLAFCLTASRKEISVAMQSQRSRWWISRVCTWVFKILHFHPKSTTSTANTLKRHGYLDTCIVNGTKNGRQNHLASFCHELCVYAEETHSQSAVDLNEYLMSCNKLVVIKWKEDSRQH